MTRRDVRLHIAACLACSLVLIACSRDDEGHGPIEEYVHALSPDGEVSALVYHYESPNGGLTQVMLEHVDTGCGSGSAAWHEYDIGVDLRWIDDVVLEVTYPDGKAYRHNASGDFLGCLDRAVRVVMAPLGAGSPGGGTYTEPVEVGHTPSPNDEISAYLLRYDSPQGGITQVIVNFAGNRGCADSAVTFYDHAVDLQLQWLDATTLEIRYPDGQRYDHPPWGTTNRCVTQVVQVRMRPDTAAAPDPDPERYAEVIGTFVEWDRKNSIPEDAFLFVGSSSIRLWPTAEAFPGKPVINRGFGGSELSDVIHFYEQVIKPYSPARIFLYAGDNDIANGKTAVQVFEDYKELVGLLASDLPESELIFISIKPSTQRWNKWPIMADANRLVREYTSNHENLGYADLATPLLDADGEPKDVFVADGLHLNERGYRLWQQALARYLD